MGRFTTIAVIALLASGLALAACGGGDDTTDEAENADFAESDLEGLVLPPDEVPEGLAHDENPSGADLLERQGGNEELIAGLKDFGFIADYGTAFEATSRESPIEFAETVAILFEDADGASEGLAFVEQESLDFLDDSESIEDPKLGAEAFGVQGEFEKTPTTIVGLRVGDVAQLVSVAGDDQAIVGPSAGGLAADMQDRALD